MPIRAVGKPVVDLIAVDEEIVPYGDVGEGVLDVVGKDGPGRVARIAEEERLGPWRDHRLHRCGVKGKVVLEAGRDMADDAASEPHGGHVRDIRRLVEDRLVARVTCRAEG